jgi:hypothetical protein
VRALLNSHGMDYPVFIDESNALNRLNHFPDKVEHQCFLLDKNNRVLLVGNPTLSPPIWELYKEVIAGGQAAPPEQPTTAEFDKAAHDFGAITAGEIRHAVFRLRNTGDHPLIISGVVTSCGCASAAWDRQPVASGHAAEVRVEMRPNEEGFFSKTIAVHCNAQGSPLQLTVSGMAVKKE